MDWYIRMSDCVWDGVMVAALARVTIRNPPAVALAASGEGTLASLQGMLPGRLLLPLCRICWLAFGCFLPAVLPLGYGSFAHRGAQMGFSWRERREGGVKARALRRDGLESAYRAEARGNGGPTNGCVGRGWPVE
jgi:hypothetical protein